MRTNDQVSKNRSVPVGRMIDVELLAIDLSRCTRCKGTLNHIQQAIEIIRPALEAMEIDVNVRQILIDSLPEPHRRTLILAELDGVKQREIASQMGLSITGAKSRVRRARKMLRDLLLACCRVELDRRGGVVNYQRREGGDQCAC